MLTFKDFIPQVQKTILGFPTEYESIYEVLSYVADWVEQEQIQVLNVETLLLPILPGDHEESAPSRISRAPGSIFQVIRVWYHEPPASQTVYTGQTRRLAADPADEQ